jgi:hypothetical protein
MSYCSCDYEPSRFYTRKWVTKSRKKAFCGECGNAIEPGSAYEYVAAFGDGFSTFKTCERCADLRDSLVGENGCVVHGKLVDEYFEYLNGFMHSDAAWEQYRKIFRQGKS